MTEPGGPNPDRATLWQLAAFAETVRHGSFARAAAELGIADKHRLVRAVERLAEHLNAPELLPHLGDEPMLSDEAQNLADAADRLLAAYRNFERAATSAGDRSLTVRCSTYPALVSIFVAEAIGAFEETHRARVRLVNLHGTARAAAGAGMLRDLTNGIVDVVIGPTVAVGDDSPITSLVLYRWNVAAAVREGHPLLARTINVRGRAAVDLAALQGWPLLTSPRGHASRSLLEATARLNDTFDIELESPDTAARVALARVSDRIAVIASDGVATFEEFWPLVLGRRRGDTSFLGGEHSLYWRSDLPSGVAATVQDLVDSLVAAAELLRARSAPGET